jgi:hypothetical protein
VNPRLILRGASTWGSAPGSGIFVGVSTTGVVHRLHSRHVKDYLLRLTDRRVVIRFPVARDAYAWLNSYAEPGEPYRLGVADGHPHRVQIIDEGIVRSPEDGAA